MTYCSISAEEAVSAVALSSCLSRHKKIITDTAELEGRRLIVTSSLDGVVKLWDLGDRHCVCELKDPGQTLRGVKGLAYSYEFGSSLLSYGFQGHINIWCPETSLTRQKII
jgi:WD40 repeat protein